MGQGGILCPTPDCGKRLGNALIGRYDTTCPRCHEDVTVIVYGERRVEDETSVTVISVARIQKPPAA